MAKAKAKTVEEPAAVGIAVEDADSMIGLVEAAMDANFTELRRQGSVLVRRLAENGQVELASHLRSLLRRRSAPMRVSGHVQELPVDGKSRLALIDEVPLPDAPIVMETDVAEVVGRFLDDALHARRLSEAGLGSGLRLMLCGPPGTGKTLLAGHIAARLGKPFQVVRLDATISSLLGDTAKNIRSIFDHVAARSGFVFLDEIDAIAKMRDDRHELGELKRVVNTLLQGLDELDDETVVIAATNHPALLDPAVWRRFPYRIDMTLPGSQLRTELWAHYLGNDADDEAAGLLARISDGLSPADIRELALASRRSALIGERPVHLDDLVRCVLGSRSGHLSVPVGRAADSEERKRVIEKLIPFGMTHTQMGRLIGVSRQRIDDIVKSIERTASSVSMESRNGP